ncbi:aldo-keto reductase [Exidia glandulosa HHB12029]|uniref:Aldo-keto reductase n=1 Tax=Exidia glandulosa HHB12029 TaxID=1314781 RepID=A0A165DMK9_EXIGL|nr:aldo-keto reductase [Exidia glandulosa HHB12029]
MTSLLPTRQLGMNGPQVTELGFGLMGLHAFYGPPTPDPECFALLDRALELGCTFWDTSNIYGGNEDMLNRYFKARPGARSKVFLATKFAIWVDPATGTPAPRGDYDFTIEAGNKAPERLGVDSVDLFYVHRIDTKTPIEITMRALVQLKNEGKIKHIGLSECSADTLRRACAVHQVAALQIEYSPFCLDIEHEDVGLLKACRDLGVAIVAYSPLSRGILSGRIRSTADMDETDFRRIAPRYSPENFAKNLELVDKFAAIAKSKGATPGQLALAWLLAQDDLVIPIPGTTRIANLEENIAASKVKLTSDEVKQIRVFVDSADVKGERYPSQFLKGVIADTPPLE